MQWITPQVGDPNYAKQAWCWVEPARNPAQGLKLPKIDNARDRVLTNKEWRVLCEELKSCHNRYIAPALALLLETAMLRRCTCHSRALSTRLLRPAKNTK